MEGTNGAGDGIRTRDIDLGKVALYQLSYSRAGRSLPFCMARRRLSIGGPVPCYGAILAAFVAHLQRLRNRVFILAPLQSFCVRLKFRMGGRLQTNTS
jgi:hypothetical protein